MRLPLILPTVNINKMLSEKIELKKNIQKT